MNYFYSLGNFVFDFFFFRIKKTNVNYKGFNCLVYNIYQQTLKIIPCLPRFVKTSF